MRFSHPSIILAYSVSCISTSLKYLNSCTDPTPESAGGRRGSMPSSEIGPSIGNGYTRVSVSSRV